jgi:hypothetical protein
LLSLIRRSFASLQRHLKLEGSPGNLVLSDVATPVVVIHQHFEDLAEGAASTVSGAVALNFSVPSARALEAGAYLITGVFSWLVAVQATETMEMLVVDVNGNVLLTLARIQFGFTGRLVGEIVIPITANIPEGGFINMITSTPAAGDVLTGSLFVQGI